MNKYITIVADALDAGQMIPWRIHYLPRNVRTGNVYSGAIPILLQIEAAKQNWTSPWWGSVADWRFVKNVVVASNGVRIPDVVRPMFNWEQTNRAFQPPALTYSDPKEELEQIVANAGIKLQHVGYPRSDYAYPPVDRITISYPSMFDFGGIIEGYYLALSHEIFHWSEARWAGTGRMT